MWSCKVEEVKNKNVRHWPAQCCWVGGVLCMAFCGQIYFFEVSALRLFHDRSNLGGVGQLKLLLLMLPLTFGGARVSTTFFWCRPWTLYTGKRDTIAAVSLVTLADQFFCFVFSFSWAVARSFSFIHFVKTLSGLKGFLQSAWKKKKNEGACNQYTIHTDIFSS